MTEGDLKVADQREASGGWGALKDIPRQLSQSDAPSSALMELRRQNKPGGFACVSCAWAKPASPHVAEFCENGAKATFAELTKNRADAAFFEKNSLSELRSWSDYALEQAGRLTVPMRVDPTADRLVPVSWDEAFAQIGAELAQIVQDRPDAAQFYASGRASLEGSFLWQLFARLCGTNNLSDSANMCHESSSVGLSASLGSSVGTVRLEDFEHTDAIFAFGVNVGTNSPRMLRDVANVRRRGAPVVVVNPLRESGWENFVDPQKAGDMVPNDPVTMNTQYLQPKPGGDIAVIAGIAKALLAMPDGVDRAFIDAHTHGFDAFEAWLEQLDWSEIEAASGIARSALEEAAQTYASAPRVIVAYGMGLTQHRYGVSNVQMICNLALMRGNIGVEGAGILAVRGHSNVQGQRTVGIAADPSKVPMAKMAERYGFTPPEQTGCEVAEACDAIVEGRARAFLGLGGNFLRAVPDSDVVEAAWSDLDLTVQVLTKLNRSALVSGKSAWILPSLGRIEEDVQESGAQTVTIEDGTARTHASRGRRSPAADSLLSEPAIIAGLAKATLPQNPSVPWDKWISDYATIRQEMAVLWPDIYEGIEKKMDTPGGFDRPVPARDRVWKTPSGRAEFVTPDHLDAADIRAEGADVFRLTTLRSNDQFNTTIYGFDDRLRGISGTRSIIMMNAEDMAARGLSQGDEVALQTVSDDGRNRSVSGLKVVPYDLPSKVLAGYFPELNPLIPLSRRDDKSATPGYKATPVRVLTT